MTTAFSVIIERDAEGYYVASVPELPGCHTQARPLDKPMERIREAIDLCLEATNGAITPYGLVFSSAVEGLDEEQLEQGIGDKFWRSIAERRA